MGGTYSMLGKDVKFVQYFGWKTLREETTREI
jgi:hypothetical protein